jgi:hypothetical protein
MCYPRSEDKFNRDQMLSTLRAQTGEGKARAAVISTEDFLRDVSYHAPRAGVCGHLLKTCINLYELGEDHCLEAAINLVKTLPDRWAREGLNFDKYAWLTHMPHSRRKIRDAFNRYLSASHLWATLIHGIQTERPDIAPDSNTTLPTFLAYSEAFSVKAARVPFRSHKRRILLPDDLRWHFHLPAELIRTVKIEAVPMD